MSRVVVVLAVVVFFVFLSGCCLSQAFVERPVTTIPDAPSFGSSSRGSWGDYNNDGLLDFIIGAGGTHEFAVYQNTDDNTFERKSVFRYFETQTPNLVKWGDYDGDGYLDLLLGPENNTGRPFIYRNNRGGSFEKQSIQIDVLAPNSGEWVDLDNDGDLDIILVGAGGGSKKTLLYRNDGAGQFVQVNHNIQPAIGTVDAGDFDQDGDADLVLTMIGDELERTEIYLNEGDWVFTKDPVTFPPQVTNYGTYAKWIDVENDGDLDIYIISLLNSLEEVSTLFINEGANKFNNQATIEMPTASVHDPIISDVDNDGDSDILVRDSFIPALLKNNGDFTFEKVTLPVNNVIAGYAVGDSDNDFDLDLIVVGGTDSFNGTHTPLYYENEIVKVNNPPQAPISLTHSVTDGKLIVNWGEGFDEETPSAGVTYNIYLFNNTTGTFKVSPHADTVSGFRRVVAAGNAGTVNTKTFKNLAYGDYRLGIQAIDASYVGSAFIKSNIIWGIAGKSELCTTDTATYSTTIGLATYNWNVTGGTILGSSNSATIRVVWSSGSNQVSLSTSLGSFNLAVKVLANPKPIIVNEPPVLKVNSGDQFQWYLKSTEINPITGATNNIFNLEESGEYLVRVQYANGCVNTSDVYSFILTDAIGTSTSKTYVYPNPVSKNLIVRTMNKHSYVIFDSFGRVMKQGTTGIAEGQVTLDISYLPNGIFYLKLDEETIKFFVSK